MLARFAGISFRNASILGEHPPFMRKNCRGLTHFRRYNAAAQKPVALSPLYKVNCRLKVQVKVNVIVSRSAYIASLSRTDGHGFAGVALWCVSDQAPTESLELFRSCQQ